MSNTIAWLKAAWIKYSPLRHAAFAFLAVQLAPVLTQIGDWATAGGPLPDWQTLAGTFGKALIGAGTAALLRWLQLQAIPRHAQETTQEDTPTDGAAA